ncbi:hypothetical protein HVY71_12460 [Citrobacter freundii]|uniref:hypothetical protein n=1 Tax=Citrobacter portucalensis TaxID=1639133 RepID=UPI0015E9B898|nr:hypothetical protein HVY71_12460 [Citrobacter freundii]
MSVADINNSGVYDNTDLMGSMGVYNPSMDSLSEAMDESNGQAYDPNADSGLGGMKGMGGMGGGGAGTQVRAQLVPAAPFHYQSSANGENVVKSLFSSTMQREQQSLNEAGKGFNALTSLNFQ